MYSPQIHASLVKELYKLGKKKGKPMTVIVNQIIREGLKNKRAVLKKGGGGKNMSKLKLNKSFEITSVCRADLKGFFSNDEIELLNDDDLKRIAIKMADSYCENIFWIDLRIATEAVISEAESREEEK